MLLIYLVFYIWIHVYIKQYLKNILMSVGCCDVECSLPILYVWMSGDNIMCQYTYVYIHVLASFPGRVGGEKMRHGNEANMCLCMYM